MGNTKDLMDVRFSIAHEPRLVKSNVKAENIPKLPKIDLDANIKNAKEDLDKFNYKIIPDKETTDNIEYGIRRINYNKFWGENADNKVKALALIEKINVCDIKKHYNGGLISNFTTDKNNIKRYDGTASFGSSEYILYSQKLEYYKNLTKEKEYIYPELVKDDNSEKKGVWGNDGLNKKHLSGEFNLEDFVKYRGPVVIAQEFYGSGVKCILNGYRVTSDLNTTESEEKAREEVKEFNKNIKNYQKNDSYKITGYEYKGFNSDTKKYEKNTIYQTAPVCDVYDDRITKIWYENGRILIEEYCRANMDVSIKYEVVVKKDPGSISVGVGVFDFIPGMYTYNGQWKPGEPALFIFDFMKNINDVKKQDDKKTLVEFYINNNFTNYVVIQNYPLQEKIPDVNKGNKRVIRIHRGLSHYTISEGCFTIAMDGTGVEAANGDFVKFMETFVDTVDSNKTPQNKVGLLFVFRDKFYD